MQGLNYLLQTSQKKTISNFAIQEDFEMSLPFDLTSEEEMQRWEKEANNANTVLYFLTGFRQLAEQVLRSVNIAHLPPREGSFGRIFCKYYNLKPTWILQESILLLNLS